MGRETGGTSDKPTEGGAEAPAPIGTPVVGSPAAAPPPEAPAESPAAPAPSGIAGELSRVSRSGRGRIPGLRMAPALTGLVLGVLWFVLGGLPFADHDEYGKVPIQASGEKPEATRVALPGGKVYLYFEQTGLSDNDSPDRPDGLKVVVRPTGEGRDAGPIEIEDVPGYLFTSKVNDTGWEPYGKIDAPAGDYAFSATAASAFDSVTVGKPPINPFGPPIVGAILIFGVGLGLTFLFYARARA